MKYAYLYSRLEQFFTCMILAVFSFFLSSSDSGLKKSRYERDSNPDHCNAGAVLVLLQLRYQSNNNNYNNSNNNGSVWKILNTVLGSSS